MNLKHALLSPSSASRWIQCPPSARECEKIPNKSSSYSKEGSLAHKCCERLLINHDEGISWMESENISKEMREHAESYYSEVMSLKAELEQRHGESAELGIEVSLAFDERIPESFGTADAVLACGSELWVIDFKYGEGIPVQAVGNPQLRIYAAGALRKYDTEGKIRDIGLRIIQPRNKSLTDGMTERISVSGLLGWMESIRKPANLAYSGAGYFKAGNWCRFCNIKYTCRARAEKHMRLLKMDCEPIGHLSDDDIGRILKDVKTSGVISWLNDLEAEALKRMLEGRNIAGLELVNNRGRREFADPQGIFKRLAMSGKISIDEMYETKPKTPAQIEKLLGKKIFDSLVNKDDFLDRKFKVGIVKDNVNTSDVNQRD